MIAPPPPLRFLLLVIGCWVGIRAVSLLPGGMQPIEATTETILATPAKAEATGRAPTVAADLPFQPDPSNAAATNPPLRLAFSTPFAPARPPSLQPALVANPPTIPAPTFTARRAAPTPFPAERHFAPSPAAPPAFSSPPAPNPSRWAGSAWAFFRDDDGGGTLAPGGTLGGSQAGARLTYRLNNDRTRPLSLSARLYTPLDNARGAEAALGIDWRPIASLPINLLAERRQAIGRDGRSDFALMVHGGGETRLANGRVRINGYGQAGIVGIEARDLFADGAITATTRIGPVDVGGGAWAGAQPGVARLDLGPHASFRLSVGRASLRAAAEWRFRVAGDAAPGSGPTLTISAGF